MRLMTGGTARPESACIRKEYAASLIGQLNYVSEAAFGESLSRAAIENPLCFWE